MRTEMKRRQRLTQYTNNHTIQQSLVIGNILSFGHLRLMVDSISFSVFVMSHRYVHTYYAYIYTYYALCSSIFFRIKWTSFGVYCWSVHCYCWWCCFFVIFFMIIWFNFSLALYSVPISGLGLQRFFLLRIVMYFIAFWIKYSAGPVEGLGMYQITKWSGNSIYFPKIIVWTFSHTMTSHIKHYYRF